MNMDLEEKCTDAMFKSEPWSSFWSRDEARTLARSVLSCLEENGMVVVPKEPHADVLAAMSRSWNIENRHDMAHAYRAAIAASPKKG
jgi:hypothetical protein